LLSHIAFAAGMAVIVNTDAARPEHQYSVADSKLEQMVEARVADVERRLEAKLEARILASSSCVESDSAPPNILGSFETVPDTIYGMKSNQTDLWIMPSGGKQYRTFIESSPPRPRSVAVIFTSDYDESSTSAHPNSCMWAWNGCQHTLWCVDNQDISLYQYQPTLIFEGEVRKFQQTYLETGPAHLIDGPEGHPDIENPHHIALAAAGEFVRI